MEIIPFCSLVHDKITGFKGIIVYRVEYLNDCIRYGVQPVVSGDGQLPDAKVLNGPNLEIIAPPSKDLPPTVETPDTFKLGVKVKDRITGLIGIAVLRVKNRYSGDRYGVQPPLKEKSEIPDIVTLDEEDLVQIDPPLPKKEKAAKKPPNGPHDHNNAIAR